MGLEHSVSGLSPRGRRERPRLRIRLAFIGKKRPLQNMIFPPGQLKHGNPAGDPSSAPRCGAKTRNHGTCRSPAMVSSKTGQYTRCRMHGGASTGPKTLEGLERCRQARWKHGRRSAAALIEKKRRVESRRKLRGQLLYFDGLLKDLAKGRPVQIGSVP